MKTTFLSPFPFTFFFKLAKDIIFDFVKRKSQSELIPNFVQHKAIERQYHTFFQWDGNNANAFFGLFGQDFKEKCKEITSSDAELETAVKSFLELGRTRNELVHFDFSTYQLSKNDEEYYALYHSEDRFVKFLREQLKWFIDRAYNQRMKLDERSFPFGVLWRCFLKFVYL